MSSMRSQIMELERTLKIEQEGLLAEKRNLSRLQREFDDRVDRLGLELSFWKQRALYCDRLLIIIENLSKSKVSNAIPR